MFQNLNKNVALWGPMKYHHPSCREGKLRKRVKELTAMVPLGQEQEAGNRREQEAAAARGKRTSTLYVASNRPHASISLAFPGIRAGITGRKQAHGREWKNSIGVARHPKPHSALPSNSKALNYAVHFTNMTWIDEPC
jgi:hypothetical protein